MKIILNIGERAFYATLIDSATARDFVSLLPLRLVLDAQDGRKTSELPRRLSMQGAPGGATPARGDLTYFAPMRQVAIFYRDFEYTQGVMRLGSFETKIIPVLAGAGQIEVGFAPAP